MQLNPTIHRKNSVVPSGSRWQISPWKWYKSCQNDEAFFSSNLNIFLILSWFKNPRGTGFVYHAVRSNDLSIHRENSAIPSGSRWQIGPWKRYEKCQNDKVSFQCWFTIFSWPFLDFIIQWGLGLCVMQLDPTIHGKNSVVPSGSRWQIGPWKRHKACQNDEAFFSADLQYFPDLYLILKSKGDWVCVSCSWIQRSIAKIPLFQVDPDGKSVPKNDTKHVKMMRPFF